MDRTRIAYCLLAMLSFALAAALACSSSDDPARGTPTEPDLSQSIQSPVPTNSDQAPTYTPPCQAPSDCEPRVLEFNVVAPQLTGAMLGEHDVPTVEEVLKKGYLATGASPTHIAFRGTARTGSARCEWRTVARTPDQREEHLRYWLGIDDATPLPSPRELEETLTDLIDQTAGERKPDMMANFIPLARGGASSQSQFLACFVDYDVHEYLLGSGPADKDVSAMYDDYGETRSYALYLAADAAGRFGGHDQMTKSEYSDLHDEMVADIESDLKGLA